MPSFATTRDLLRVLGLTALSAIVAALAGAMFMSLVACHREPRTCVVPPRPAIHCPDLQLLVFRTCAWRCE